MRTIKFTMKPEQTQGMQLELQTECIVDENDIEAARQAGATSNELMMAFMMGFSGEDGEGED